MQSLVSVRLRDLAGLIVVDFHRQWRNRATTVLPRGGSSDALKMTAPASRSRRISHFGAPASKYCVSASGLEFSKASTVIWSAFGQGSGVVRSTGSLFALHVLRKLRIARMKSSTHRS